MIFGNCEKIYLYLEESIMNLPNNLLECLNIKKIKMAVQVDSFQEDMKAGL